MVRLCPAGGRLTPDIDALFGEASRLFKEGQFGAAVKFYQRILEVSPHHPEALQPLGVIAQRAGKTQLALQLFEEALEARPDMPAVHYNRSVLLRLMGRNDEALEAAQQAVVSNPQLAEAWDIAGQILKDKGDYTQAYKCHMRALGLQPRNAHFNGNYALLAFTTNDLETAFRAAGEAQKLDPFYPPMLMGNILQAMGHSDLAAERFAKARAIRPDFPAAAASEAMVRLQLGEMELGWQLWEQRPDLETFLATIPLWNGEKIDRLVVYEDQGLGDALQFMRYLPLLKNKAERIYLRVREPLHRLCAQNFPDMELIGEDFPVAKARVRLASLPGFFNTRLHTIPQPPYLAADIGLRGTWRDRLKPLPRTRIGVAWAGNPGFRHDHLRSLPFTFMKNIIGDQAAHFVSLQRDRESEKEGVKSSGIFDAAPLMEDFAETAALIAELDLVITADTAVAHLAGGMNKPVWIMLPFSSDWRWMLGREDSPWYPSARLFRQKKQKQWGSVIEQIQADAHKLISGDRSVLTATPWQTEPLRRHPDAISLPA